MNTSAPHFQPELTDTGLRTWLARVPSCVVAVTATVDDRPYVMIASSFVGISLSPAVVGFCPQTSSSTWPLIRQADMIGVSVLAEHHTSDIRAMAAKEGDRLAGVDTFVDDSGTPFIADATAWLQTTLLGETPLGDHTLAALAIRAQSIGTHQPLIFHGSTFKRCVGLPDRPAHADPVA